MKTNERGNTIIIVISLMATMAVLIGAALDLTSATGLNVRRSTTVQQAETIANGALQHEFMYWREILKESSSQALPSSSFSSIPLPTSSQFPNITPFSTTTSVDVTGTYTISNYSVVAVTPEYQALSTSSTVPPAGYGPVATGTNGQNVTYYYLASVDVSLPSRGTPSQTFKAREIFRKQYTSPWDWAIFFIDPLEINPGAPFTVTGPVQTNSDLYTAYADLTFENQVTYGGNWYIGFMSGDGGHNGVTPAAPSYPSNEVPAYGTPEQPFGINPDLFSSSDVNPNNDGYHELIEIPNSSYTDPLAADRYYNQASVRVIVNSSDSVSIYKVVASGTTYTQTQITSRSSGNDLSLYNAINGALTKNDTFQDNREANTMNVVDLDVGDLASSVNNATNGSMSEFNGIIYISNSYTGNSGANDEPAVRLLDGATAPSGGLTVASPNAVYIQGDYNTGSNPPSDSGNSAQPTNSNYNRTNSPCAVIADAVDILSNAWNDNNSTQSLSSREATNTTVNAAIISGIVPTGTVGNNYSGGAENFPRFLEDWGNATFTYYGSMVELYDSKMATGAWGGSNVYGAPTRKWYFDTNFSTNPPPGTIMVVNYDRMQWWQD